MTRHDRIPPRKRSIRSARNRHTRKKGTAAKNIDSHVSNRIRNRRLELGLTQQALAQHHRISYQQMQKYETGHNRVSAGRLFALSKVLNVNIDYFYKGIPA